MWNRWEDIEILQAEYKEFQPFLYDIMTESLGYKCTEIHNDIAEYIQNGPKYRMVQAQRGQSKTTITAIYAAWRLIQDPTTRILIISAGSSMADEIANWIIRIIRSTDILECLRPDRSAGDRTSIRAFDIHHDLKGSDKSPSIACTGITSNMQGKRADLLIADDVESVKNSQTATQRERLLHLTRDFPSICSHGDIVYLGTPQNTDTVYKGLTSRGCGIRIWPGRYPTHEQESDYGDMLAPLIKTRMDKDESLRTGGGALGIRGRPVDPELLGEDVLSEKELYQGAAYFQLQHMLDSSLVDQDRFPLKPEDIIFMNVSASSAPLQINFQKAEQYRITAPLELPSGDRYYHAAGFGEEFSPFQATHMYVDPAGGGQNGDETGYAVTRFCAGRIFCVDVGGVPGGLTNDSLDALTAVAEKWRPSQIDVEKNFGNGALCSVWTPLLFRKHRCRIEDVWETGQKELRIIDALEPVIGSNRLVMDQNLLQKDWSAVQQYPMDRRASYSLFHQISTITRDKASLIHDDRIDALAGTVRHWVNHLKRDSKIAVAEARRQKYDEMMRDPLGNGVPLPGYRATGDCNILHR